MRPMYLLALLVLLCAQLQGCAVYGVARDERTVGTIVDDRVIITNLKKELLVMNSSEGYATKVYSYSGRVFLVGEVAPTFRDRAVEQAHRTSGVRSVATHWFNPGVGKTGDDIVIESKVRSALIADGSLSSTQIDSEVYGGHVVLLGVVGSQADSKRATDVARKVGGVRSVTTYIMIDK